MFLGANVRVLSSAHTRTSGQKSSGPYAENSRRRRRPGERPLGLGAEPPSATVRRASSTLRTMNCSCKWSLYFAHRFINLYRSEGSPEGGSTAHGSPGGIGLMQRRRTSPCLNEAIRHVGILIRFVPCLVRHACRTTRHVGALEHQSGKHASQWQVTQCPTFKRTGRKSRPVRLRC